jgi:type IV pilus assembly protein PilQ
VFALAPLLLFAVIAGAADTQLKEISVTAQGGATVVALETAGPFTHNEYRPQPSMVLVDLQKVSSSALKQRQRSLDSPAVKSYRVLEYKSVGGIGVTRVELTVTDAAKLQVKETKNGLQLLFTSDGSATASHATPAAAVRSVATSAPAPKPTASVATKPMPTTEAASLQPVTIRNIGVVRTSAGMAVEIEGAKTAKTLRLSGPERLVVDVENSFSGTKQRTIMVNAADLKSVRISQFQLTPPVTRVVLDLTGPRDFNLANRGNKLVVTVLPPRAAQSANLTLTAPSPKVEARATSASAASPQVKPIAATERLSAALAFAPLTQTASMNSSTAVLRPVGSAFIDQTTVNAVSQKEPPAQKDAAPVSAEVRMDEVFPVQKAAPAPAPVQAPQAILAKQSGISGEVPAKPAPEALSAVAQKNPDYVFVVPDYKKQTVAPVQQTVAPVQQTVAPAPVAINPASTRAIKAATTVAEDHPPVLIAKAQPQTPPAVTEPVQPEKPPALPEPVQLEKRPAPTPAANLALEQQKASATPAPPPAAKKYTGEPISVNLKDVDLKDFFRLVHEISGLNIVLDPSVRGTLTLVLDDVPWDQALDVVLHNNGLGRELEGNILRIAAQDTFRKEAEAQRARIDAQALAVNKITVTRFLSYGRAKDVMPTIKKLLTTRGEVLADDRTNGLIISDIPSIIPSIDRLITQLDRKTMQVEIEARVVSATRNFAQQFGTQLGFAWGNGKTSIGGNPSTGLSSQTYTSSTGSFPYFTSAGSIPLFSNLAPSGNTSGLALSTAVGNYRVDVLLSAAESRGLAKVLSRPRVVTQNNVTAVVRQGYRIPIVTQSQLGGPATTTYIDAFLRLTVTPQITVENTIFLAVDVENTTPDFGNSSTTVGGNPSLLTQQATTQVLVSDGGTVVIGGVIQTQSSINIQQVPWLGNIPILGNLFKSRSVSTSTQELIFILSPKIVQT